MLRVKQVKGAAKVPKRIVETLKALGLGRIGTEVRLPKTPVNIGMLRKVEHLVTWVNGTKETSKEGA